MKKIITLVSFCLMMLVAKSQSCQTSYSAFSQTVCDINPYTFNNHALSVSGTYTDTLINFHGCDSVIYLYLNVLPSNILQTVSICNGNTYLFKGQQLSSSGIYKDSLTNYLGCDSIITLNLTASSVYPNAQKLTVTSPFVCGSNPDYFIVSETDTTTNIPSTNCTASNGGKLKLNYVQVNTFSSLIQHTNAPFYNAANGSSITKLNTNVGYGLYTAFDTSYLYPTGASVMMWIDLNHSGLFDANELLVNTQGYSYSNSTFSVPAYTLPGATLMRIRTSANGAYLPDPCVNYATGSTDDFKVYINSSNNIYELNLVNSTSNSVVTSSATNAFWSQATNSGYYFTKVTNQQGCSVNTDSVQINSLATSASTIYDTICHGSSLLNGVAYNHTGTYTANLTNAVGCDSVVTLNLISNISFTNLNQNLCHGSNFVFKNQTLTTPGTYYDTLINYIGCDSLVTLSLVLPTTYTWVYHYLCAGAVDSFKHQPVTSSGYYYDTLPDHANCGDSIIVLYVYFYPAVVANAGLNYTGCGGNGITLGGFPTASGGGNPNGAFSYSWSPTAGLSNAAFAHPVASPNVNTIYKVLVTDVNGCSSTDSMQYNVTNSASYSNINQNICTGSYFFNNHSLAASGVYYDTLINNKGCDSIITLNLAVGVSSSSSINQTICSSQPYFFHGNNLVTSGLYYDTLSNYTGCDSIITLNLAVLQSSANVITQTICGSQLYSFNGQNLNTSGIYYDTLTNAIGCDSLITLHLSVNPISNTTLNQSVCAGNTYFFKGQNLSVAGIYKDTLTNYLGCDSFVVLNLIVNPLPVASFTAEYRSCKNSASIADIIFTGSNTAIYAWVFTGATPSSSTTANSTINYSSSGTHQISLTATSAAGCWLTAIDTVSFGANCIWPGDANNDLVANNLDIFPIGQLNGTTGPVRNHASLIWTDQPATPFATIIPGTTTDARFADCNGDGVIDGNDTTAIIQNYGLIHVRQKAGTGHLLNMTIGPDTMYQNTNATILVGLGSASVPADSIYGVAFSFHVDPTCIDTNSIHISTPPSWLFANSTDHFQLYKLNKSGTIAHVGLVRNNHIAKSGYGDFVTITIDITTGNIVGRQNGSFDHQYKFHCSIDNISILKLDGSIVTNVELADSSAKILYNKNVGVNNVNNVPVSQTLIPNPANNLVKVKLNGYDSGAEKQLVLLDAIGRIVLQKTFATNQIELNLLELNKGIYIVKIISEKGVSESKLMKE